MRFNEIEPIKNILLNEEVAAIPQRQFMGLQRIFIAKKQLKKYSNSKKDHYSIH